MSVVENSRPFDEAQADTSEDEGRRQGRAMLPRLHAVKADKTEPETPATPDREQPAPFNAALELVRAASEALERMRARVREVEAYAQQEIEYHRSQLATADAVIRELDDKGAAQEESIRQLQSQLHTEFEERQKVQRSLDELKAAFERLQEQLRNSETRANAAEAWLARLHSEIASAFSELPALPQDVFGDNSERGERRD